MRHTLTRGILSRQFDMVCYLANGRYGVTIGEADATRRGSVFPATPSGDYAQYLQEQVIPVLGGTQEERRRMAYALALPTVEEKLRHQDPYIVDIRIEEDGQTFYKQFDFYRVDPDARFYILLKSDTTQIQMQHLALNEQLRIALDAANQASVAKTAFLSSMSHEIRTPMNAIIGLDRIALADDDVPPRTREHLKKIGSSAQHLLGLINDILDMSRIESGRMTLASESFSFAQMLDQISTMIGGQCQERGLRYDCDVSDRVADYYVGDVTKIKQVLINILGNSVKFTEPGGSVRLSVEVTSLMEDRTGLRFVVADTGVGMDPSFVPHIFDAFSQESATSTSRYGSTGLGMAITKSIVEMMQGEISVQSKKGVGTTFVVDVVLGNAARRQEQSQAQLATPRPRGQGRAPCRGHPHQRRDHGGGPGDGGR